MSQVCSIAVTVVTLLTLNFHYLNAVEIGEVKCTQNVQWAESFYKAHEDCRNKIENESKKGDHDKEEEWKPFPRNATLEEFDYDDKCQEHCAYKAAGILTKDGQLPDKTETAKLFTKGKKISDESFSKFTATWDECLEKTRKIAQAKKLGMCKTVALHDFCFFKQIYYDIAALEVQC